MIISNDSKNTSNSNDNVPVLQSSVDDILEPEQGQSVDESSQTKTNKESDEIQKTNVFIFWSYVKSFFSSLWQFFADFLS